ncbi:B12-binding domain-containing radical SAM protein [Micromonospora sp. MS34]|uniref:B12-binding domain-containing radical SAM protein n=1 Tax=Micromonospora sp. MS34 TaxID=3385971 RepID=UPI0039A34737
MAKAREDGFTAFRCLDANIEALNHLARPTQVAELLDEALRIRHRIEDATVVTRMDELRYQDTLAAEGVDCDFVERAIAVMRDPDLFYHHPTYRQAVMAVRRWLTLLSLAGAPAMFDGFGLRTDGAVNYSSFADLGDDSVVDLIAGPFEPYIRGPFREVLAERRWELVGLSVNYRDQLPIALRLAREIRQCRPDTVIVFGGTEVCDDIKYARDRAGVWSVFRDADLLVPGEGESPLSEILAAIRDSLPLSDMRGVLTRKSDPEANLINYENVSTLPTPAYEVWDWNRYWSPEPVVNYSPTRGCYWNKCTFCDYGLNTDRPTAPSRERSLNRVAEDLAAVAGWARSVYFAVDAMSPRYLRTLCERIADEPHHLRWSAELRLERTFPKRSVADLLKAAGCVAVSFGYESGSQRILDLINKGVRIDDVPAILADLAARDIGVQMMGFTGFPSETPVEARETYEFLIRNAELWSLAGIGTFQLTPGSIVARQPDRFGVEVLPAPAADDIQRYLPWRMRQDHQPRWPGAATDGLTPDLTSKLARCFDDRPFVGGIDSAHSMLYFARYGSGLLPSTDGEEPRHRLVGETIHYIAFDNLHDFTTPRLLEEAHATLRAKGSVTHAQLAQWLGQPGAARAGRAQVAILATGVAVALPQAAAASGALRRVLQLVAAASGAA